MSAPTEFYQPYAAEHQEPKGEGDARPEALNIIKDQNLTGKWTDKVVLITGCNGGMGLETARALHATGAKVFITARTKAKAEPAVKDILSTSPIQTPIEILELELDSLASVRSAAQDFLAKSQQLNILIANAGIMAPPYHETTDGFESQIAVNHLSHFLLFQLLKPTLLSSATPAFASRVVLTSSSGHKAGAPNLADLHFARGAHYDKWAGYAASKTANMWMANGLERRYGAQRLHAMSVHPGPVFQTSLARDLGADDFKALESMGITPATVKNTAQGAATQVWCATARELEGRGGVFCSDCGVARPAAEDEMVVGGGFAPHAYDEAGEERLWEISCAAVGVARD